jgi:O-antigen ligase
VDLLERSIDSFESPIGEHYSGSGAFLITRVDSFFVGAVGAANILLVSLPLLLHIGLQWRSRGSRLIALLLLPLASILLVFTFSRAAIAILLLLLATIGVLKKGTGRAVLFGALVFSVITLAWAPLRARMMDALDPTEPSNHIHLLLYQGALSMIAENPLVGIGPGLSPMSMPAYAPVTILASWGALSVDTHNFVLQVAAEYGLPAAVFLVYFLGTVVGPLIRSVRRSAAESLDFPTAAFFSLSAAILMSLTSNGFRIELFWVVLGLAAAASCRRSLAMSDTPADGYHGR